MICRSKEKGCREKAKLHTLNSKGATETPACSVDLTSTAEGEGWWSGLARGTSSQCKWRWLMRQPQQGLRSCAGAGNLIKHLKSTFEKQRELEKKGFSYQ
jgi:hypothetical protein